MGTRGFVTIATGSDKYYQLAANLLHSYRKYAVDADPFAIICDRHTRVAEEFDQVILMEHAFCSYMDKLMLYHYAPFDETIFIDADSLILADPKGLWDDFSDADDVSCYGSKHALDSSHAWFTYEGCGKYKDQISFLLALHGGIYFIRKSERANTIFEKAIEFADSYNQYSFRHFSKPADEPVLAMSLAIHQSVPCVRPMRLIFVPSYWGRMRVAVSGDLLVDGQKKKIEIIHFATQNTNRFLYRYMVDITERNSHKKRGMYSYSRYLYLKMITAPVEIKNVVWHSAGYLLRKLFPEAIVARIKAYLHR